jgi:ribosomal protein S18 acetylase RimI-like enzyme
VTATLDIRVRRAGDEPALVPALVEVLTDCVAAGASVSFMWPLPAEKATRFWQGVLAGVASGERVLLIAEDTAGTVQGTVQLLLATPENQPHRAELCKMLVHPRARRRGLGAALVRGAEAAARESGRSLLVLDTVTGGAAERLYARLGWQRVGEIPDYALWPRGGHCSTTVFYRALD